MKNNKGITIITLVITIIVIILISSITIYSGLNTMNSVRKRNATDITNAIFLALTNHEDLISSDTHAGKKISELDATTDEKLSDEDFRLLGLNYTVDSCKITFSKSTGTDSKITYVFDYEDNLGNKFNNLSYNYYKEVTKKTSTTGKFDTVKKINRPVITQDSMVPIGYDGEPINNVYTENWYNYEKGVSKLATMKYEDNLYVWIPRFAYRIQTFYDGKSYEGTPTTSIDIVFLRDDTSYMPNGETLDIYYQVHPAFQGGKTGFWIMAKPYTTQAPNINSAVTFAQNSESGHLMKNSEYAAAMFLSRFLNNTEIEFNEKEFTAAGCDITNTNFDIYSSNSTQTNYIENIKGQALKDTPWDYKMEPSMPTTGYYLIRNVSEGGLFYYSSTNGNTSAVYRSVITK